MSYHKLPNSEQVDKNEIVRRCDDCGKFVTQANVYCYCHIDEYIRPGHTHPNLNSVIHRCINCYDKRGVLQQENLVINYRYLRN